jgi:hypothetical protein
MNELGFTNIMVYFAGQDITPDQLIDHVLGGRVYTKELVIINKQDLDNQKLSDEEITKTIGHSNWIKVSALNAERITELQQKIFKDLELIRVYLKPPQQEADMKEPIILPKGATLQTLCEKLHKSFVIAYRYAMIWGPSAKHPGQKFSSLDHELIDGDIVSIYLKRG